MHVPCAPIAKTFSSKILAQSTLVGIHCIVPSQWYIVLDSFVPSM